MHQRAVIAYKKVFVESASPVRVLDELYTRLLRDLDDASKAIGEGDIKAKSAAVSHGIAILTELDAALDHATAPEMSGNLSRLYNWCAGCLNEASLKLEIKPLDDARKVLVDIRDAFRKAAVNR